MITTRLTRHIGELSQARSHQTHYMIKRGRLLVFELVRKFPTWKVNVQPRIDGNTGSCVRAIVGKHIVGSNKNGAGCKGVIFVRA